jgi:hypothetical protein
MNAHYLGLIEAALTAIIVLGFCAYQYWATSRSIARDKASARDARHSEREHHLDDR